MIKVIACSLFYYIILCLTLVYSQRTYRDDHPHHYRINRRKLSNMSKRYEPYRYNLSYYSQWDSINDQITIIITSTMADHGAFIRSRIIPCARTWLPIVKHVYVVVEDTAETRFTMRYCEISESRMFTLFDCPGEATYILTRNCTSEYYAGPGICCKVDSALQYLTMDNIELFDKIQYAFICDDDEYWRMDQVFKWLLLLNSSSIVHELPIIGNDNVGDMRGVWSHKGCSEINTWGWYQPMLLNKNALRVISKSVRSFGIRGICAGFHVSQDVGLGIWAWQNQLYHIHIPKIKGGGGHGNFHTFHPEDMLVHSVKHYKADKCTGEGTTWGMRTDIRFNQTMMIGCGSIDRSVPTHNRMDHMNMYDAWKYFEQNGTDIPFQQLRYGDKSDWIQVNGVLVPYINRLVGYNTTEHYQKYYNDTEWHPYTSKDCSK